MSDGSTQDWSDWILADDLEALAASLGIQKRRLADWRERGVIPHPTRIGFAGRRPIWAYPPGTDARLRSVAKWRERTDDFDAIRFGVWIDGNPVPLPEVRASILHRIDRYQWAMLHELERIAGGDTAGEEIINDPDLRSETLDRFANELAGMRGRFPVKRQVEMTLHERTRGMNYWLHTLLGLPADDEDAVHLERIMGVARGRTGTAEGLVTWPPRDIFPQNTPLTADSLREAVNAADADVILAAGNAIHAFYYDLRFLFPIMIPPRSPLKRFAKEANRLFDATPPQTLAFMAAVFISSMHRQQFPAETVQEYSKNLTSGRILGEIFPALAPEQQQEFLKERRRHT